jgi:parallel beta-helix repeat protein
VRVPVFRKTFLSHAVFVAFSLAAIAAASSGTVGQESIAAGGSIVNDTVWEGTIRVERSVSVVAGARLTIRPGSRVLFADGTELNVAGTLLAVGTSGNPIRFMSADPVPEKGRWKGISLAGTGEGSVLTACVVTHAEGVRILAGGHEFAGCALDNGVTGIFVASGAFAKITGSTISDMTGFGVDCQKGAAPIIDNNIIRGCGTIGVNAQRDSGPRVTSNTITGCDVGISYNSPTPSPEGNRIEYNRVGIGFTNVGGDMYVARSRFAGNGTGLWLENFSSPRIEGNIFDNNDIGIFCYRSSSPGIVRNRIVRNRQGIVCQQLSEPRIVGNDLAENGKGVFLTLSSYAVMNGNNFDNNAVQIELGVMSHDWEVKVGRKPVRGGAMRGAGMSERLGRPAPTSTPSSDAAVGSGIVDATGNWWGDRDTAGMEARGADANIGSLIDGRDTGPRKSEGYEGEFARDRIDYSQWKAKRIPDAGIPGEPVR